jgi:hypothetical protein
MTDIIRKIFGRVREEVSVLKQRDPLRRSLYLLKNDNLPVYISAN